MIKCKPSTITSIARGYAIPITTFDPNSNMLITWESQIWCSCQLLQLNPHQRVCKKQRNHHPTAAMFVNLDPRSSQKTKLCLYLVSDFKGYLVGGFNPFEQILVKMRFVSQVRVNIKKIFETTN